LHVKLTAALSVTISHE